MDALNCIWEIPAELALGLPAGGRHLAHSVGQRNPVDCQDASILQIDGHRMPDFPVTLDGSSRNWLG